MGSRAGKNNEDLWSEIIAAEVEDHYRPQQQEAEPQIAVIYQRKKAVNIHKDVAKRLSNSSSSNENRPSLAPTKRVSWNRSLSTRGRASIAVTIYADYQPQQRKAKRKTKPPLPRGKTIQPPNYDKERAYFHEVDSFKLMEESPSPKKSGTWTMGIHSDIVVIPYMSSILRRWLISKKLNHSGIPSASLSKILETPAMTKESCCGDGFASSNLETPEEMSLQIHSGLQAIQNGFNSSYISKNVPERHVSSRKSNDEFLTMNEEGCEDIEVAVRGLSLTSRPASLAGQNWDSLLALLTVCRQSSPSTLLDVLSKYCGHESISKVGEGTYGEAFKVREAVCKIVPFGGDLRVNGEVPKRSDELFDEVVLSWTLNRLRGDEGHAHNICFTFIETVDIKVCQGPYDAALTRAWEEWDGKHGSENDHPNQFPEKQCYVVFVQEHGGQDLESFVLLNFDEARSLLVQVTLALAVAEAAYEFEHRDLHWGNILLSRKASATLQFTLEGRQIFVRTFGLLISIIDFTLSRINTG
ncbi:unnamed protein product [Ilex paraguariensis]|uniref:Protein kinase domain-containing protein n=2 Tax=Ilex paraguariensis TaxID=185542 RepID=A0ABC8RS59_9AQUA